ncbi:hypothetical protein BU15DRAFT_54737 [Melanogaster broomeanus]|nr:hypothetical protein BU15DRAFT_54737 [Melanogaster broomeanus]
MPKVVSHWKFHRHFCPLTCQSIFPPEHAISPPPLTQHRVFPREEILAQPHNLQPIPLPSTQPKTLIPKPRGDVSRINRGGYNLQQKLGWPTAEYDEIRAFVSHLAGEHLSVRADKASSFLALSYSLMIRQSKERYPLLKQYDGDWVVSDFLRVYLKNTSTRRN